MSLEDMETNIDKMISEIQSKHTSIKDCSGIISQQICEIREKLNKHLDTLEIRLKEELSKLENKAENDIQLTLKSLKEKKIQNVRKRKQMDDMTKHLSSDVKVEVDFLQSLQEDGNLDKDEIEFELDENITTFSNNINKFGSFRLRKIPSSIRLESQKGKQAQTTGNTKSIDNLVVQLVNTINTTGHSITGCDFLPDGNIVMCNYSQLGGDFIAVFDSNGIPLNTIPVKPNYAFDVVSLDKETVGVTSPTFGVSSIMSINIRKEVTQTKTEYNCYSITFTDGKFLSISSGHGIITIDANNGKILSTIRNDLTSNSSLTSFESKIYVCDPSTYIISCCDMEGSTIWSFKDGSVIKNPRGIAVDGIGNVYVTNQDFNNVIVMSSDGNQCKQLLSQTGGLKNPRAIQYDRIRNRLLVTNMKEKAFIFDISR
ncbi:unnamed protein product [Mytilus coruscus]|uniref:TRIM2_3 n=1 Tax=Mytilus coruscus TaxID=42192 RepID=A0A6J8BKZ2_MYTCO|nr:unnamed protein product [Mytilus coruscus]